MIDGLVSLMVGRGPCWICHLWHKDPTSSLWMRGRSERHCLELARRHRAVRPGDVDSASRGLWPLRRPWRVESVRECRLRRACQCLGQRMPEKLLLR